MKKLRAGVVTFALTAALAACVVLVLPQPVAAGMCVPEDPFLYIAGSCKPEPGTQYAGKYDYVKLYLCLGHYDPTGTPCNCTYLGCVLDPTHQPPDDPQE